MKAPLIVDALRARDPGAPAALYDTHGESLFRYCWFLLRNTDAAQVALRDALVVAESHIGELGSPGMLRPWLYALARGECQRRQQSRGAAHDTALARPDQADADRRLIAWHAVMSLDETEREALELTNRHDMDAELAGLIMGLPPGDLPGILERGRVHLEQALAGEILARHGVAGCLERARALQGWAGELTVPLRDRLVEHAWACQVCERYLPRNVSAGKVFSLLPEPVPPPAMRLQVMTCFADPELVGYRMFVASRVGSFSLQGFPTGQAAPPQPPQQRRLTARQVWSGPAAAAVAVAVLVAAVLAISRLGGFSAPVQNVSSAAGGKTLRAVPTPASQPGGTSPASGGHGPAARSGHGAGPTGPASLTTTRGPGGPTRLYVRTGSARDLGPTPRPGHSTPAAGQLQVAPGSLALGSGSTGQIRLTAAGGPVTWSASASSSDIVLSSSGGTIAAGQQVLVTVSVTRAQQTSGSGTITFGPGGAAVTVSWSDPGTSPPPSGSPSPTVQPGTPSPSPSASSSMRPGPSAKPSPSPTPSPSATPSPSPRPSPAPTVVSPPGVSPSPPGS